MPVCVRTELFGCYRSDSLSSYQLSKAPLIADPSINKKDLVGIGHLANGRTDDYDEFDGEEVDVTFSWSQPLNLSHIEFYTFQRSRGQGCLKEIDIQPGNQQRPVKYTIRCDMVSKGTHQVHRLEFIHIVTQIEIKMKYAAGNLLLSEIKWIEAQPIIAYKQARTFSDDTNNESNVVESITAESQPDFAIDEDLMIIGMVSSKENKF